MQLSSIGPDVAIRLILHLFNVAPISFFPLSVSVIVELVVQLLVATLDSRSAYGDSRPDWTTLHRTPKLHIGNEGLRGTLTSKLIFLKANKLTVCWHIKQLGADRIGYYDLVFVFII